MAKYNLKKMAVSNFKNYSKMLEDQTKEMGLSTDSDSKNVNLHYVDNYFVSNMENLKVLATKRVLSGSRASMNDLQGLFSIADKSGQNAQQKESATYGAKRLSQMFGLNK